MKLAGRAEEGLSDMWRVAWIANWDFVGVGVYYWEGPLIG